MAEQSKNVIISGLESLGVGTVIGEKDDQSTVRYDDGTVVSTASNRLTEQKRASSDGPGSFSIAIMHGTFDQDGNVSIENDDRLAETGQKMVKEMLGMLLPRAPCRARPRGSMRWPGFDSFLGLPLGLL